MTGVQTCALPILEAAGLIVRVRAVEDERRVHLTLTAAGRRLKARAAKVPGCVLSAAQCSVDELVSLTQQVKALRARLLAA